MSLPSRERAELFTDHSRPRPKGAVDPCAAAAASGSAAAATVVHARWSMDDMMTAYVALQTLQAAAAGAANTAAAAAAAAGPACCAVRPKLPGWWGHDGGTTWPAGAAGQVLRGFWGGHVSHRAAGVAGQLQPRSVGMPVGLGVLKGRSAGRAGTYLHGALCVDVYRGSTCRA